ncbi:glycoside hydrolase family 13 protein [Baudoinia panamericana UAMH 10762]|uniref:Glycoside hydrolase family 13 protein n=1 Tax=Baudoinia panamericana (strain UAMH 10762) TaxID=717646 RepID=M2MZZ6_BAUPA|nr:glycoside hydrolase family 13 protein [Baudoinia panamericana UAMH 10762]EMC92249.1 glycoside hydrolase family 13 protein [Baudoinia panamericana UAMH 10762]
MNSLPTNAQQSIPPAPETDVPSTPAHSLAVSRLAEDNPILFQAFEWHTVSTPPQPSATHASQTSHYPRLTRLLPLLSAIGITSLWLPPGCKANNAQGNGYDCYDLWDLGEFDQKWTRSVKWGSREELSDLKREAKRLGVSVIWDAVLNHKTAGDATEECWAVEVDKEDRRIELGDPRPIEAYLRFDFPGRKEAGMPYSDLIWHAEHFNGTDWDAKARQNKMFKLIDDPSNLPESYAEQVRLWKSTRSTILAKNHSASPAEEACEQPPPPPRRPGRGWANDVDDMHGNADYLMFSNIDYTHPAVRQDTLKWGEWMVDINGVDGFRLDAVQHFSYNFTREWIARVQAASQRKRSEPAFIVGEIWTGEVDRIVKWLDVVGGGAFAYDSPLLYNFSRISEDVRTNSKNSDLRTILRDSLLEHRPHAAVTLVTNHDTQPGQTSFTPMLPELKALWYAFILLRSEGYPCVFWGDLYGMKGHKAEAPACLVSDGKGGKRSLLPDLMLARRLFAFGEQKDHLDSMTCVAWTREGHSAKPGSGCVVLLSIDPWPLTEREQRKGWFARTRSGNPKTVTKKIPFGKPGEVYIDLLANAEDRIGVIIDSTGAGTFGCKAGTHAVAVFVRSGAVGVDQFPVPFVADAYKA